MTKQLEGPDALTIQILTQINDNLSTLNDRVQKQEATAGQVLQRLVRLEERSGNTAKIEERIEKVETALTNRLNNHSDRLTKVEARGHRQDGMMGFIEWLNKLWPFGAALIGAVGIYLGYNN